MAFACALLGHLITQHCVDLAVSSHSIVWTLLCIQRNAPIVLQARSLGSGAHAPKHRASVARNTPQAIIWRLAPLPPR